MWVTGGENNVHLVVLVKASVVVGRRSSSAKWQRRRVNGIWRLKCDVNQGRAMETGGDCGTCNCYSSRHPSNQLLPSFSYKFFSLLCVMCTFWSDDDDDGTGTFLSVEDVKQPWLVWEKKVMDWVSIIIIISHLIIDNWKKVAASPGCEPFLVFSQISGWIRRESESSIPSYLEEQH